MALIGGAVFLLSRFNVGERLAGAAGGAGGFFPDVAKAFTSSFAEGAGELGSQLRQIGENFQRQFSGGLLLSEQEIFGGGGFPGGTVAPETLLTQPGQQLPSFLQDAFRFFEPRPQERSVRKKAQLRSSVFAVKSAFNPFAQQRRIQLTQRRAQNVRSGKLSGDIFGGFDTAQKQEAALQKQIALSRQQFPEFFQ